MRIQSLEISNFRAIRDLRLSDLSDAVVIAGPNGCGKSSIFDAVRLLKSAYGQYHQNEYGQWFSEFNINVQQLEADSSRVLFDPNRPLSIRAEFQLAASQRTFLRENAKEVYKKLRWSRLLRKRANEGDSVIVDPKTRKVDGQIVESDAEKLAMELLKVIDNPTHIAALSMEPGDAPTITGSPALELVFSVYRPAEIGIIDYQAPTRVYGREQIGSINLRIKEPSDKDGASALYNAANKYTGVKTEMAQSYVMELLADRAGVELEQKSTLKSTLDELFSSFFPGKKFLGATPTRDGGLEFPVELEGGRRHDINELSSGEKEVLLGYLHLRNSSFANSIILFDEPELHLNPMLARSLPRFYERHIGKVNSNQIWLVTHSDAILREAVQEPAYTVFHMRAAGQVVEGENQADRVIAGHDVESAVISLVGDLASYSPRSKVVLLEGENSEVDARIISQLYPDFLDRVNLVSLGAKKTVSIAHQALEKAAEDGKLGARFFSIVDRDFGGDELVNEGRRFAWDRYHIENYLIEPDFIRQTLQEISGGQINLSAEETLTALKHAASETILDIARIRMEQTINKLVVGSISFRFDRQKMSPAQGLDQALERSLQMVTKVRSELTSARIEEMEQVEVNRLKAALRDETWLVHFRGRNVLRKFVGAQRGALSYDQLRNLVVARMREADFRPEGMTSVIEKIALA